MRRPPSDPGRELLTGIHPVREALRAGRRPLYALWIARSRRRDLAEELAPLARAREIDLREVDPAALARRAGSEARPQGVALEVGPLPPVPLERLAADGPGPRWLVAADGVEDPRNLGAIVRVADAAGARGLVLPERRAAPLTPVVSRASAGAVEHLPVARVVNLPRALRGLKQAGFWILGADPDQGTDLYDAPDRLLEGDLVLVLGAEGRGIRPGVAAALDARLRIPMGGAVASLNVAAAGAVILFEWVRRRRATQPADSRGRGRVGP